IGTEATVHDTLKMADHMPLIRKAGIRALWIGVEDMSGALVRKGQTPDDTIRAFHLLWKQGICPMPMMMHHDGQKLVTRKDQSGLLNQIHILRKAGAGTVQVLMITPSPGSKLFDETYTSGMVYESVGKLRVEEYMVDGNYVIASHHPKPWRKQLNILAAYAFFYNPVALLIRTLSWNTRVKAAHMFLQLFGMWGLTMTIRRTLAWPLRLMLCRIKRRSAPPTSLIPMTSPTGRRADHAIPGTPGPAEASPAPEKALAMSAGH
ncbi:MAG: radical SAM protein, partial [Phycisphaerae bacterium]|nr:radical SAM protein [Phycisphaerae bacterium]